MGKGEIITRIGLGKGSEDEVICWKEDSTVIFGDKRRSLGKRTSSKNQVVKSSLRGEGWEKSRSPSEAHQILKLLVSLGL